jgi:hypothetical protein
VATRTLDLPGDEFVVGVEHQGLARAYPVSVLWQHHIVNDELGGKALLASFCLRCFSGASFDPLVDGDLLEFDVFGRYLGAMVMKDDRTGSLWSHLSGEALAGPLVGRQLALLPSEMTTLARWLERYPDSTSPDPAVTVAPEPVRPGSRYSGGGKGTVPRRDPRLDQQALVLGISIDGRSRAYVLPSSDEGPRLYQDELGGAPIVLLAPPGSGPLVYDRRTASRVVDLRADGDGIVDASGTRWTDRGRAIDGPLAGTSLAVVPSRIVEWYAWAAYFPETDVANPFAGMVSSTEVTS